MTVTENRDELIFGAMQELAQTRGWKVLCEEIDKYWKSVYVKLLEVREDQDKPVYTADQLYKRELHYLEWLKNLPTSMVKQTTTYVQNMSDKL